MSDKLDQCNSTPNGLIYPTYWVIQQTSYPNGDPMAGGDYVSALKGEDTFYTHPALIQAYIFRSQASCEAYIERWGVTTFSPIRLCLGCDEAI